MKKLYTVELTIHRRIVYCECYSEIEFGSFDEQEARNYFLTEGMERGKKIVGYLTDSENEEMIVELYLYVYKVENDDLKLSDAMEKEGRFYEVDYDNVEFDKIAECIELNPQPEEDRLNQDDE